MNLNQQQFAGEAEPDSPKLLDSSNSTTTAAQGAQQL